MVTITTAFTKSINFCLQSSSRGTFEAPPPPRFDLAAGYERSGDKRDRDYKRDYRTHVSCMFKKKTLLYLTVAFRHIPAYRLIG